MVTNEQLYLMIGVPIAFNALLTAVLIAFLSVKFKRMGERLDSWIKAPIGGELRGGEGRLGR